MTDIDFLNNYNKLDSTYGYKTVQKYQKLWILKYKNTFS